MVTLTYQERFKTLQGVFDEFTHRQIFELQSKKIIDELVSPLKVGKESNVFIALKGQKKVIVKIYRVQNCDFKRMFEYIRPDPRYRHLKTEFTSRRRREIIFSWAQREYLNLQLAERAGVRAPQPLGWKYHIIVEEFIGNDEPAPPLKDCPPEHPQQFFDEIIIEMKKLYRGGLVHGDLSAFNILNFQEKPVLIDFSQSTLVNSPNSEELLVRDVTNIVRFFSKLGVKANEEDLIKKMKDNTTF